MDYILSFKNYKDDYRLNDFIKILSCYEDRSFLARKNNYNLITFSFIENESNLFEKGKDFVDAGYQLTSLDSSNKVVEALFAYYFLESKKS